MRRTFVTSMPDEAGAFLKASECFYRLQINIIRVSYNKAIDTNTLFIEVESDEEKLNLAYKELEKLGYITKIDSDSKVILVDFKLDDMTGDLVKMLSLILKYNINISYINTHEISQGVQNYRMALFVEDASKFSAFYSEAKTLFQIDIIDYDEGEVSYDNSLFYRNFIEHITKLLNLNVQLKGKLAVNVNKLMQILDEKKISPSYTFEIIKKFAEHLAKYKGENFIPRISEYEITNNSKIIVIEPPCGSNATIIKSGNEYLFVDSGFACYENEILKIYKNLIKDFDTINKKIVVTHADVDHSGLLHLFDEIYVSEGTKKCFELESQQKRGFREQNALHLPYVRICKLLTSYNPPSIDKLKVIAKEEEGSEPIYKAGNFSFNEFNFEVYLGQGGHLRGETILLDREHKIVFTGDIYVNLKGYTQEQAEYNKYAPILMTSVDSNPVLAKMERNFLIKLLGDDDYLVFSGHGEAKKILKNRV